MTNRAFEQRSLATRLRGDNQGSRPVDRVSTLELFFDLVFVFTITQLTSVIETDLSWQSLWHVAVMLALIFYMYDGYAWLTNAVPADGIQRQALLLGGMAGYLVVAIAIPDAFDGTGLAFGLALFVITAIHAALYVRAGSESSSAAMLALAPANLGGAALIVVGGAAGGDVQVVLWLAAVVVQWAPLGLGKGFEIGAEHFVERHGLLVIVAIGESVVAIGIGASHRTVDLSLLVPVVLGLAISACLWWTYFGNREEEGAVAAMHDASPAQQVRIAYFGFGYGHYALLLGVVLVAVGIERSVAHPGEALSLAYALALTGGASLFVLGDCWFRRTLGLGRTRQRLFAGVAVLGAIPVATQLCATAGLAAASVLLIATLALDRDGPYARPPATI